MESLQKRHVVFVAPLTVPTVGKPGRVHTSRYIPPTANIWTKRGALLREMAVIASLWILAATAAMATGQATSPPAPTTCPASYEDSLVNASAPPCGSSIELAKDKQEQNETGRPRSKRNGIILFDYRDCCCENGVPHHCLTACMTLQLANYLHIRRDFRCVLQHYCEMRQCLYEATRNSDGKLKRDGQIVHDYKCKVPIRTKVGQCPFVDLAKSGFVCRTECDGDISCGQCAFGSAIRDMNDKKCCPAPCGVACSPPGPVPNACERHRMDVIGKIGTGMTVAQFKTLFIWVPECKDADRGYSAVQCVQNTNHCFCVDRDGQEIAGTRGLNGTSKPDCSNRTPKPLSPCEQKVSEVMLGHARDLTNEEFRRLDIWLPFCQNVDPAFNRSYNSVQCLSDTGSCWCSTPEGYPVIDLVYGPEDSFTSIVDSANRCPSDNNISACQSEAGRLALKAVRESPYPQDRGKMLTRSELEVRGFWLPRCQEICGKIRSPACKDSLSKEDMDAGGYLAVQCSMINNRLLCWCVARDGTEFPHTIRAVPQELYNKTEYGSGALNNDDSEIISLILDTCNLFRSKNLSKCETLYWEQLRTHRLQNPRQKYAPFTVPEEEAILLPQCVPQSNVSAPFPFAAKQCSPHHCWCVDDKGTELPNTRQVKTYPKAMNCTQQRLCPVLPCFKACPSGFTRDENDCQQCECQLPCPPDRDLGSCLPSCWSPRAGYPGCRICNESCMRKEVKPCGVRMRCDYAQLCVSTEDRYYYCLITGIRGYPCWYTRYSTTRYSDAYRSAFNAVAPNTQTCMPGMCCETLHSQTRGVCYPCSRERECDITIRTRIRDGTAFMNTTSCLLCNCKKGVLNCSTVPSPLLHHCSGREWETQFIGTRPKVVLLSSHKQCKEVVHQRRVPSLLHRTVYDGETVHYKCNWCKCQQGRFVCTSQHCTPTRQDERERCPACADVAPTPVCAPNQVTYQSACHAVECGLQDAKKLKLGSCVFVDPCKSAMCIHNETCVPRHSPCFTDTCPQHECILSEHRCGAKAEPGDKVCGVDDVTYSSLCFLEMANVTLAYEGACDANCTEEVCGNNGITYPSRCHASQYGVLVDYEGPCLVPQNHSRVCSQIVAEGRCRNVTSCTKNVIPEGSCCPICGGAAMISVDISLLITLSHDFGSQYNHTEGLLPLMMGIAQQPSFLQFLPPNFPKYRLERPVIPPVDTVNFTQCFIYLGLSTHGEVSLLFQSAFPTAHGSLVCHNITQRYINLINAESDIFLDIESGLATVSRALLVATEVVNYSGQDRQSEYPLAVVLFSLLLVWTVHA